MINRLLFNIRGHHSKKVLCAILFSICISLLLAFYVPSNVWTLNSGIQIGGLRILLYRAFLLFFVVFFLSLHFVYPVKKIYDFMFKYRWYIGVGLLLFVTLFKINGDSMAYYTMTIQGDKVDALSYPIFGKIRTIRSDEFLVNNPGIFASVMNNPSFEKYNTILRGTDTLNIISGVYKGLAMIAYQPWKLIFTILPLENAFSFYFYFVPVFAFLFCMELFYILSKNKLVAFTGATLTIFSSYFLWWGFPNYLLSGTATIVFFYKFINEKNIKKQIVFGLLMALSFSIFVCNLYPAWQVPVGYVYLVIGIWMIKENFVQIKSQSKVQWFIFFGSIGICILLVLNYFISTKEYIHIINQTVYPGKRVEYGSNEIGKLLCYAQSLFFPIKDMYNNSESGVFFCLFPLSTLLSLYYSIKSKKKDLLSILLLTVEIPMIIYTTIGLPPIVAKLLLFTHSTSMRMIDILGFVQVILIIRLLSFYKDEKHIKPIFGSIIAVVFACESVLICKYSFPDYLNKYWMILLFILIFFLSFYLMTNYKGKGFKKFEILISVVSICFGICVRPISIGLSSVYAKPAAQEIQKIVSTDPKSKWVTIGGIETPSFTVMCGAPTITFVNTYPNLKLWHTLDPNKKYEKIYNRYEHVKVLLTQEKTSFELIQSDYITLKLSYKDINKAKVKYIFANGDCDINFDNGYVSFDKIYDEDGAKIYKLSYN
ncbi:DUF7657 domain-containing protein [Holdemanella porci]|uniref:DUF7657 domain-containing protein n=1 Tax=Holdemanella porci TaxID=2652276 RepID=UPI003F92D1E5